MHKPRGRLTPEQQGLAARYVPLAMSLARPLKKKWPRQRDELESAALMGLVQAARTFDPAFNVKFATFARYRICGALREAMRFTVALGFRKDFKDAPTVTDFRDLGPDFEPDGCSFCAATDGPVGWKLESVDTVEGWLRRLPREHATICRQIYLNGRTKDEAARHLGVAKYIVTRVHAQAIEILQWWELGPPSSNVV